MLQCPDGTHSIRVFSTGKGSESVARSSRNKIRNCEHRDIKDPLGRAQTALEDAERLLGAAGALLDRGDAQTALEEALEMASEQIADAEAAFDLAGKFFDEATERMVELLGEAGDDVEPDQLVDNAGIRLREVKMTLRDLPPHHDEVECLKLKLEGLKQVRDELVRRLDRYETVGDSSP